MESMRVLIVDDSVVVRRIVERTLRESGLTVAEVLEAGNGLQALKLLHERKRQGPKLTLILADICMPVMDGLEFVEQMRAERLMQEVPVVMLTAEGSEIEVRRALAAGVAGYIRKPFTVEQVQATIVRLAGRE